MCQVVRQNVASPDEIWKRYGHRGAISKADYDAYFEGALAACAIEIAEPLSVGPDDGVTLRSLGASRPPQSFQYLRNEARGRVLALAY